MGNVQPDVTEIRSGLAHLCKDIARFNDATLVGKHSSNAIGCPNIARISAQHLEDERLVLNSIKRVDFLLEAYLLEDGQCLLLMFALLLLVATGLMQCLQREIAQSYQ